MGPLETRDLVFASAGILWGLVTAFDGIQEWRFRKFKPHFPAIVAAAAVIAITCFGYLVHRL